METGKECSVGEKGELRVRAPNVCIGYKGLPKETSRLFDEDKFLCTGHLFSLLFIFIVKAPLSPFN